MQNNFTRNNFIQNNNACPPFDEILVKIADYVCDYNIESDTAFETARYCLMDAMGCAILALNDDECRKRLGPVVSNAVLPNGVRIPGTDFELEPVHAAFNIGTMIRWLDYNDTWLAAEWGHPSDNLGAILACADYINRQHNSETLHMQDVLYAMIKAYEIQGVLALENSFNQLGIDHVILVKIASCAVATVLLGGNKNAIINALSNAWLDGGALRTYRHAPNTGWRKSWAAGDAASRAVRLALMAVNGETGYASALSAAQWGFYDVLFKGKPFKLARPFTSYVIENILFKVAYPVEFHAQTAVECAIQLHDKVKPRLAQIDHIFINTQQAAMRIINKTGPLHNHADRDHSLQYAIAIGLLFGDLQVHHYSDEVAADPRIDLLREKMQVAEDKQFSADYLDAEKRAIANEVIIQFTDGQIERARVKYPIGHHRRRQEAIPLLIEKFEKNVNTRYSKSHTQALCERLLDHERLMQMPVDEFMGLWPNSKAFTE